MLQNVYLGLVYSEKEYPGDLLYYMILKGNKYLEN